MGGSIPVYLKLDLGQTKWGKEGDVRKEMI